MSRRALAAVLTSVLVFAVGGCTGPGDEEQFTVVVSAPLTTAPWVGRFVERGARLAVEQANAGGGVALPGGDRRLLRLEVRDNAGSPRAAADDARNAVASDAVALITDGVGAEAVAAVTDPASLPVFVVFEGGEGLVDASARPTLYRLAPADRAMATRLGDYLSGRTESVALVSDDSSYGRQGAAAVRTGLGRNGIPLLADEQVPAGAADVAPQVLRARAGGAQTLVVWAGAPVVAAVVRAARSAGWDVPVFTGPSGEDPLVRQQLADRPEWVSGLTFVSFRITSEVGPEPFATYRSAFEARFGTEEVGVTQGGQPVLMPPDWSTYSYDAVRLVVAALERSGEAGRPLVDALHGVVITGANGDERGFGPTDREGVSPDDMYFGRFDGFVFTPVRDDILSTGLPGVPQT